MLLSFGATDTRLIELLALLTRYGLANEPLRGLANGSMNIGSTILCTLLPCHFPADRRRLILLSEDELIGDRVGQRELFALRRGFLEPRLFGL
jgi:hypothetical protein